MIKKLFISILLFFTCAFVTAQNFYVPPVIGDIDTTDFSHEILIYSPNGELKTWYESRIRFPENWWSSVGGYLHGKPVIVNVYTQDENLEVVVATYDAANGFELHVFHSSGVRIAGIFDVVNSEIATFDLYSSPVFGRVDIDRDGFNELILLLGSKNGELKGWVFDTLTTKIVDWTGLEGELSPLLTDFDNDGDDEIIVASGSGKIYSWDYIDTTWIQLSTLNTNLGIGASPMDGDIDGDGILELVTGSYNGFVCCWEYDTTSKQFVESWRVENLSNCFPSSPVTGNFDDDDELEIAILSDKNEIYILNSDGTQILESPIFIGSFVATGPNVRNKTIPPLIQNELAYAFYGSQFLTASIFDGNLFEKEWGQFYHFKQQKINEFSAEPSLFSPPLHSNMRISYFIDYDFPCDTFKLWLFDRNGVVVKNFICVSDFQQSNPDTILWDGIGDDSSKVSDGEYTLLIESQSPFGDNAKEAILITIDGNPSVFVIHDVFPVDTDTLDRVELCHFDGGNLILTPYQNVNFFYDCYDAVDEDVDITFNLIDSEANDTISLKNFGGENEDGDSLNWIWKGIDEANEQVPDGIYEFLISATDDAGNAASINVIEPASYPGVQITRVIIDRKAPELVYFMAQPSLFITPSVEMPFVEYQLKTTSDTASFREIIMLDITNDTLFHIREDVTAEPGEIYQYVLPDTIDWSKISDGYLTLKMFIEDSVGNYNYYADQIIKNKIPALITFPFEFDNVGDWVNIEGIAADPDVENTEDFLYYELFYKNGVVSGDSIGYFEALDPVDYGWSPISVPNSYQSPEDTLYPNSHRSYRTIIDGFLGNWDANTLTEGNYTIMLTTKDGIFGTDGVPDVVKHLSFDVVSVSVSSVPPDSDAPEIQILKPLPPDTTFTKDEPTDSMEILYSINWEDADIMGAKVSLEIFKMDGVYYGKVVYHQEYETTGNVTKSVPWDFTDAFRQDIESGYYRIRFTARDKDGVGMSMDEVGIYVDVVVNLPLEIVQFYPDKSSLAPNEGTNVNYKLSEEAKSSIIIFNHDNIPVDTLIYDSIIFGDTLLSIFWSGTDTEGLYNFKLSGVSTDFDSTYASASFPTVVTNDVSGWGITAEIYSPEDSVLVEGESNFDWEASGEGIYLPMRSFEYRVIGNLLDTTFIGGVCAKTLHIRGESWGGNSVGIDLVEPADSIISTEFVLTSGSAIQDTGYIKHFVDYDSADAFDFTEGKVEKNDSTYGDIWFYVVQEPSEEKWYIKKSNAKAIYDATPNIYTDPATVEYDTTVDLIYIGRYMPSSGAKGDIIFVPCATICVLTEEGRCGKMVIDGYWTDNFIITGFHWELCKETPFRGEITVLTGEYGQEWPVWIGSLDSVLHFDDSYGDTSISQILNEWADYDYDTVFISITSDSLGYIYISDFTMIHNQRISLNTFSLDFENCYNYLNKNYVSPIVITPPEYAGDDTVYYLEKMGVNNSTKASEMKKVRLVFKNTDTTFTRNLSDTIIGYATFCDTSWGTKDDPILTNYGGKIYKWNNVFNNSCYPADFWLSLPDTLFSEGYPVGGTNKDNQTFWIVSDSIVHNPHTLVENWNVSLYYPNGDSNDALSLDSIFAGNDTTTIDDCFDVKIDKEAAPEIFVPIVGTAKAKSYGDSIQPMSKGIKDPFIGYCLFYKSVDESAWHPVQLKPNEYISTSPVTNNILGFWNVTGLNSDYEVKLVVAAETGVKEELLGVKIGSVAFVSEQGSRKSKFVTSPFNKVYLRYSPDTSAVLEFASLNIAPLIYETPPDTDSIVPPPPETTYFDTSHITITPMRLEDCAMMYPDYLPPPVGVVYDLQPHGLTFLYPNLAKLTVRIPKIDIIDADGNLIVDLSQLMFYHIKETGELEVVEVIGIADTIDIDEPKDGIWDIVQLSAWISEFSYYFVIPDISPPKLAQPVSPTNQKEIALSGKSEPGSTVEIFNDGVLVGTKVAGSDSNFSFYPLKLAEGMNTITAQATRWIGQVWRKSEISEPVQVILDITPPEILAYWDEPDPFMPKYGETTTITYVISEDCKSFILRIADIEIGEDDISAGDHSYVWNGQDRFGRIVDDGTYTYTISVVDHAGNPSAPAIGTVTVVSDTTPPVTVLTIGEPKYSKDPTYITSSTEFILTATDDISGVAKTEYAIDETSSFTVYSSPFIVEGEGAHTIYYRSIDNVGNVEETHSIDIAVDNTPPVTSFNVIGPSFIDGSGKRYVTSDTELELTAEDPIINGIASGIAKSEYRINNGDWITYSGSFTISGSDGDYIIDYRSIDNVTNVETYQTIKITLDNTPPVTTISIGKPIYGDYITSATLFTLTAFDSLSGVQKTEYRINGGEWVTYTEAFAIEEEDGDYLVEYHSIDNLENTEEINSITVKLDNTPPITSFNVIGPSFTDGSGKTYITSNTELELVADDPVVNGVASGVKSLKYKVEGSDWVTVDESTEVFNITGEDGEYTIEYYTIDNVGNEEEIKTKSVFLDNTPPITDCIIGDPQYSESPTCITSATPITLDVTDSDGSGVKISEYRIDTYNWVPYTETVTFNLSAYGEGMHTIYYRSVDNVDNQESEISVLVAVDDTHPLSDLAVGDPNYVYGTDDSTIVTSSTPLTVSAYDPISSSVASGVKNINYKVGSGNWETVNDSIAGFNVAGDDGEYEINYYSIDNLDNEEGENTDWVILDNTPPVCEIISPLDSTLINCNIPIIGTVTDIHFKYYKVEYGLGDNPVEWIVIKPETYSQVVNDILTYWDTSILNDGAYTVRLTAIDVVGNASEERVLLFIGKSQFEFEITGFNKPEGVDVDATGFIYVAESNPSPQTTYNRVAKFDAFGNWVMDIPDGLKPNNVVLDSAGNIYVTAWAGNCMTKYSPSGDSLMRIIGFNKPDGIDVDKLGNIYIADQNNNRVVKYDPDGNLISEITELEHPEGVSIDRNNNIYVVEVITASIKKYDPEGNLIMEFGDEGSLPGQFIKPSDVTVDSRGYIWVVDRNNDRVQMFDSRGNVLLILGTIGHNPGEFNKPEGIAVDESFSIFVADRNNGRVQKFSIPTFAAISLFMQGGSSSSTKLDITEAVNYPNPFNPEDENTNIRMVLTKDADLTIKIYNLVGKLVWKYEIFGTEGINEIEWNGTNELGEVVNNGVYNLVVKAKNGGEKAKAWNKIAVIK